nr:SGNH/GDSL hydrolase family protein [uncultured Albidiferax sp.]
MALKHTQIYQPDPTKPQPGSFEAEHVDEMGNPPPLWVYGGADGKTIVGIKKPDGTLVSGDGNENTLLDIFAPTITTNGLTVSVSGSAKTDGVATNYSAVLTLDAPATGNGTASAYALKYSSVGAGTYPQQNPNAFLYRRRLSNVVITPAAGGAALVQGTDYNIDPRFGTPWRIQNVADLSVNISYTYAMERYDLLQIDPVTLVTSIVKGTERDLDAHDFLPVPTSRNKALYYLYVRSGAVEAIPVHRFDGLVRRDARADFAGMVRKGRDRIPKTRLKLARGLPLKILGYGDSITAWGDDSLFFLELVPRVGNRDNLPTYTREGTAFSVRFSRQWVAVNAIKAAYGYVDSYEANPNTKPVITYVNRGVGGTDSSSSGNNGLSTTRLNEAVGLNADLVTVAFGANEQGSDFTYAQIKAIVTAFRAVGTEVIILDVPKRNILSNGPDYTAWRKTNRTLALLADDLDCGYVPTSWLVEQGGGGLPFSEEHFGSANYFNHPGVFEQKLYGQMLATLLLP